jgi:Zn-finger nucleic acid-binding protein
MTLVLVCESCPYAWEPGTADRAEVDSLIQDGCPDCGGWLGVGEIAEHGGGDQP